MCVPAMSEGDSSGGIAIELDSLHHCRSQHVQIRSVGVGSKVSSCSVGSEALVRPAASNKAESVVETLCCRHISTSDRLPR